MDTTSQTPTTPRIVGLTIAMFGVAAGIIYSQSFLADTRRLELIADHVPPLKPSAERLCRPYEDNLKDSNTNSDGKQSLFVSDANARAGQAKKDGTFRYTMTHVVGSSAVGKSTLLDLVVKDLRSKLGDKSVCVIRLDWLKSWSTHYVAFRGVTHRPDLHPYGKTDAPFDGGLPAFDPSLDVPSLVQALSPDSKLDDALFVLVDSVDEIHPESVPILVSAFRRYFDAEKSRRKGDVDVYFVGRPEGFAPLFRQSNMGDPPFTPIYLVPPNLSDEANLKQAVVETCKVPKLGVPKDEQPKVVECIMRLSRRHLFFLETVRNQGARGEIARNYRTTLALPNDDADAIKDQLFEWLLARNYESHRRPNAVESRYQRLLQQVAVTCAGRLLPENDGYFQLPAKESDRILVATEDGEFHPADVLSRSGIAYQKPHTGSDQIFKFDPIWLHPYLVDEYNRRVWTAAIAIWMIAFVPWLGIEAIILFCRARLDSTKEDTETVSMGDGSASPLACGGIRRCQVFISYSHTDTEWLDRLQATLKPLIRKQTIDVWVDTRIKTGQSWKDEITRALARAKVAVLLVSQDFLASDFIANEEIPRILAAAQSQGLTVVWVPVTASLYEETDIADYQAAHDPTKPLDSLNSPALNKALVAIAKIIGDAANR